MKYGFRPTDEQKMVLHLMLRMERFGRNQAWLTRDNLLDGKSMQVFGDNIPELVGMRLMWAVLSLPYGVVEWSGDNQSFRLSALALEQIRANRERRLTNA